MNPLDLPLVRDLDAVEAAAYRDMFAAAPTELAPLGLETREVAGATLLMAPGLPTPMFNRVIGLGNAQPASDDDVDRIVAAYREAGIGSWWMHLSPGARPASLGATLERHGFAQPARAAWVKVLRDEVAAPEVETGLEIRSIRPGEEQALGEALCAAFEMRPSGLAGRRGDRPGPDRRRRPASPAGSVCLARRRRRAPRIARPSRSSRADGPADPARDRRRPHPRDHRNRRAGRRRAESVAAQHDGLRVHESLRAPQLRGAGLKPAARRAPIAHTGGPRRSLALGVAPLHDTSRSVKPTPP